MWLLLLEWRFTLEWQSRPGDKNSWGCTSSGCSSPRSTAEESQLLGLGMRRGKSFQVGRTRWGNPRNPECISAPRTTNAASCECLMSSEYPGLFCQPYYYCWEGGRLFFAAVTRLRWIQSLETFRETFRETFTVQYKNVTYEYLSSSGDFLPQSLNFTFPSMYRNFVLGLEKGPQKCVLSPDLRPAIEWTEGTSRECLDQLTVPEPQNWHSVRSFPPHFVPLTWWYWECLWWLRQFLKGLVPWQWVLPLT